MSILTVEQIAEQVYRDVWGLAFAEENPWAEWEHAADLIELTRYRLDNPQAPLGAHHSYYCALLDARDEQDPEKYPQKRFEFLSIEDIEQDLLVVKSILELRPEWENYGGGEPPAWEE